MEKSDEPGNNKASLKQQLAELEQQLAEGCRRLAGWCRWINTCLQSGVWGLFLLFGGLFFISHFLHIGFMPDMDLNASVTVLAVSALTGGFLLIFLGFYLQAPGWTWKRTTQGKTLLDSPWWFGFPALAIILFFVLAWRLGRPPSAWQRFLFFAIFTLPPAAVLYRSELRCLLSRLRSSTTTLSY